MCNERIVKKREVAIELKVVFEWQLEEPDKWEDEVDNDKKLAIIKQQVLTNKIDLEGYTLRKGCLLFQGRLVISKISYCIPLLVFEFHITLVGGHSRYLRIYKRLSSFIYWEEMNPDLQDYVAKCQYVKSTSMKL